METEIIVKTFYGILILLMYTLPLSLAISKKKYYLECAFDNGVHVNGFWVSVILENEFALSKVIEKGN